MNISPGARLVFIGDSVTDCGRARPVGEGSRGALGKGYVAVVDATLSAVHPANPIRVANMGISGDTVRDLAARWDTDVLALAPDWLSVMIGINDVWRQFRKSDMGVAVMPDEFESTYDALVARTRAKLKGLILMTPFYVQGDRNDPMRRRLDEYRAITIKLAARHGALLVDTQAAIDLALAEQDYAKIAEDRVHPTKTGHAIIARAFLRAA
jgi:lysophospholipase L1-like esterase